MDRSDYRYGSVLHGILYLVETGSLRGPTELADIRAGDESSSLADHDDSCRAVVNGLGHSFKQSLADMPTQGIDRGIINDDEGDLAFGLQANGVCELRHVSSQASGCLSNSCSVRRRASS